jgi:hypothetical protein
MKLFILALLVCTIMAGCASHPLRTGKIVVTPFDTKDYKTNNPMQVRDDVAERLSRDLQKSIIKYINEDSKMTMAKDCSDGDYILTGRFEQIDSSIDSHWRFVTVTVNQKFDVDIEGFLKSCKTGKELKRFDPGKGGEDMSSMIDSLGDKVVSNIRKDESITLP